ncbi:hypothetical protein CLOSTMETH_01219 [[Clostridium] methylpentosum DSM 5476]|uniref:Uncharacterized protein n=1 Tax=[Clostridium] methylpentosum DSM 5476 TaxID=537013 RepID=C0EBK1_9FIRM|nr:hypothetical protein CLOSTMETH_01219 [[Clostridium] methylpentosum DSM 5476]
MRKTREIFRGFAGREQSWGKAVQLLFGRTTLLGTLNHQEKRRNTGECSSFFK